MFNLFKFSPVSHACSTRLYASYGCKKFKGRKPPVFKKVDAAASSVSSRGFLRSFKPYAPPADVEAKISAAFTKFGLAPDPATELSDAALKFSVLNECSIAFGHCVPNSLLNDLGTMEDVVKFYKTPVNTTVPYDALAKMELPKNLHIQQNYLRFHPDTDTMFNGISVFTKSSTLVTGLKYKKKYPGYEAKTSWP